WTPADNLDDPTIADPIASNLLTTTTFNVVVNTFVNTADDSVEVTVYDEFLASIAADQIICYNTVPGELTSTVSGGQGNYTYQWQVYDTDWVDIENATNATYQPGALTVTTLYRLVVSEFCGTVTTNEVTVTVYGEFLASIAADQIICYNTVPDLLTSTVTGGEGTYTYQWEKKEGDLWVYIADANDPTYQPPALTISMMYRLFVTDLCGAITTDSVTITVYDDLMASIAADQVICEGTAPEELTSIVSGGEGTYTYQWQIDTTGVFEDIAGATAGTYQPGNLYGVALYQLVVTDYCGTIISDTVSITFYDALAASIAADQTICVNTAPDELTSTVTGGQGNYAYQWQLYALDSTLVENCYGLDDFAGNYYSNSLTDAGWTTYNVVEDVLIDGWTLNIGTLTADSWPSEISLWAKSPAGTSVNLYTPPSSGTFYDLALTTTDFDGEMSAGVWEIWFTDSYGDGGATAYTNSMCIGFISVGAWVDISGAYASTYQPPILTDMMLYRLEVTDFCGLIYSNEVTVTVIQLPVAYAGEDDEVCADEIYILQGDATDYSTVLWTTAGDGTFDDATLLNATYFAGSDDIDAGFADLTLTAFSIEPCTEYDEDYVTIFFTPLPTANAGDDAMICEDDFFMTMGWTTNAYGILWTTSGDGYFDNPQSTAALYFPGANDLATGFVVLTLTANPIPPCTQQVSDDMMLEFGYLPTAYAGEDATVCGLESYPLAGEATEYSTVLWTTSGDGIFDNAGSLTALYTPGDDDIANGSATLTLTVYAKAPCTGEAVDDMVLTIIPLPEANAGPDATVCEGDGYELSGATASNYGTVSWETSGTGTFDDPHILHPVYTGSSGDIANGSVVLSLTATAIVPCPGYDYDEMTLSFSLIPTADAGEDDAICEGEVYVLAGVATDYTATEWTTAGDGTFDDSALLDATYTPGPFDLLAGTVDLTLTAFAASPCPDDAVDVMTLMIALNPSADAGLDDKICEDETYTLSGMAENYDMIIWTTSGDGTFDNNTLLDATYHPGANDIILGYADLTLTAYPISPCAFAASDVMTLSIDRLPDTPGTPEGDTIVCALPVGEITDYTTTGSPNALSYYWEIFPEIAGIIEGEGTTATVTWSGDYIGLVFIKVQGINDCGAGEFSDPIEVYADDCTGLPEDLNAQLDINVYPNPSDGIFNLEISGATGMMELYILDYKGQLIHQDKIENVSGDYLKELDISTYPKGIYFLKLVGDKVMRIEKIVIR
ncbi:MAG: T9SS type A sorting domain-containing protein, partial [Bacteroidales bacterium]|nr:T9SS type A sorting domain-containing protein [Bacteroidales bacterium]